MQFAAPEAPAGRPPPPRTVMYRYEDPLSIVWLAAAAELGWRVRRSDEVYASWDGRGTLTLSEASGFDADDSLAQLILHEMCHALIEGEAGLSLPDFGLENIDERHLVREHATHRLQATLADRVGLRRFFAVTTDWRPYYDALPADPMADGGDPAVALARSGLSRAAVAPWASALDRAMKRTADILAIVRPLAAPDHTCALDASAAAADARC